MAMNTRKTVPVIVFIILMCTSLVGSALAQASVSVGVSQGDSFKYDLKFLWSSTNRADVAPASWASKNQTEYFQVNVDVAVGTALRISTVWRFMNGTEFNGTQIEEVGNNTSTGFIYIYAANLDAGSYLFPSATDLPFMINSTGFRTYENNEFRATNHIMVNRTDLSDRVYSYMDLYFDKESGVLVEATLKEVYTDEPNQVYTTRILIKESSLWSIPATPTSSPSITTSPSATASAQTTASPSTTQASETPTANADMLLIVLVIVFVIIIIIIIFIFLTRRPKNSRQPSKPETKPTETVTDDTETTEDASPGLIKCKKCGFENPESNEFCGKCGKRMHK